MPPAPPLAPGWQSHPALDLASKTPGGWQPGRRSRRDISPDTLSSLDGVWAEGTTGAWVVGEGGLILHWDGTAMNTVDGGTQHNLSAVTGTGPTDVWVAGDGGTVLHWDGSSWAYAVTPNGEDINCAWSPQPNEVWIGDVSGTIWRYVP